MFIRQINNFYKIYSKYRKCRGDIRNINNSFIFTEPQLYARHCAKRKK